MPLLLFVASLAVTGLVALLVESVALMLLALPIVVIGYFFVQGVDLATTSLDVEVSREGLRLGSTHVERAAISDLAWDEASRELGMWVDGKPIALRVTVAEARTIAALVARPALARRRTFVVESDVVVDRVRTAVAVVLTVTPFVVFFGYVAEHGEGFAPGLFIIPVVGSVAMLLSRQRRTKVVIGRDGVAFHGMRRRFVPRTAIAAIEDDAVVTLVLEGGERIVLEADEERPNLQRALAALCERGTSNAQVRVPELATTPVERWIDAARREQDDPGYRVAALDDDARWRVAEGDDAPIDRRAAAVIALAGRAGARVRLSELEETVAADELRAVIDAAAREDDEALVVAVTALKRMLPPG